MKNTIQLLFLVLFSVACNQAGNSGGTEVEPEVELEQELVDHGWRRTVSCEQSTGCTFRAIYFIVNTNDHYMSIEDYKKANGSLNPGQGTYSEFIGQTEHDFVAEGTGSLIATPRDNPSQKRVITFTPHSLDRMTVCIDSDCGIYDKINRNSR